MVQSNVGRYASAYYQKAELSFPFFIDRVLPDPCGGPSFLVSARKEHLRVALKAINPASVCKT